MRTLLINLAAFAVYPLLASAQARRPTSVAAAATPIATADNGVFIGVSTTLPSATQAVQKFLGMPFAKPPQRFSPPESAPPSTVTKTAQSFGAGCIQQGPDFTLPGIQAPSATPQPSEDCLFANVWTPSTDIPASGGRAVLVWIYGGAFVNGKSSSPLYDGGYMAATQDVVVVSFNYRLAIFGFTGNIPGIPTSEMNVGMLDARLAIDWVRRNIRAFGGDPNRITLFGESAGGIMADLLALTTTAPAPWKGMILQSGTFYLAKWGAGVLDANDKPASSESAKVVAADVGCGWDSSTLDCLRSVSASQIKNVLDTRGLLWGPVEDGGVNVPVGWAGSSVRSSGGGARVPILTGSNYNEGILFQFGGVDTTMAHIFSTRFPELKPYETQLRAAYPYPPSSRQCSSTGCWPDEFSAVAQLITDYMYNCLAERQSRINTASGVPSFRYVYNSTRNGGVDPYFSTNVPHTFEIPQVFRSYNRAQATTDQVGLSQAMQKMWADFAKNPTKGPGWPAYSNTSPVVGLLGGPSKPQGEVDLAASRVDPYCAIFEPIFKERDPASSLKAKGVPFQA